MATGADVLSMLCPQVEYSIYGSDYENINWFDKEPAITKKQFEDGFAKFDAWKIKQDQAKQNERQAILDRIGLTADELQTILG